MGELLLALQGCDAWEARRRKIEADDGLISFLRYAATTISHYRAPFVTAVPTTLTDFPLTSREDVAARPRDFISDVVVDTDKTLFAKTSGTTGRPLTVIFDLASWYDLTQGTYATLARTIPGLREAARPARIGVVLVTNESMRQQMTVPLLPLRCTLFRRYAIGADEDRDQGLVKRLRRSSPLLLHGKPSYLRQLSALDGRTSGRGRIRPLALLVSGENLFEDVRARLEDAFACRVYNAYTSAEGGLIALQCSRGKGLHVQHARVRLEVLRADGRLRDEGSGELVLTNLSNWAMPFIRYQTGDQGTIRRGACACGHNGPTLVQLPAREATAFRTVGGTVTAARLARAIRHDDVADFQLTQFDERRFSFKWIPASTGVSTATVEKLLARRLAYPLRRACVEMRVVEAITKPGGKVRRFVAAPPMPGVVSDGRPRPEVSVTALGAVRALAFSPAGDLIAVAAERVDGVRELLLCDVAGRKRRKLAKGCEAAVTALAVGPNGQLVTAGDDRRAALWDLETGDMLMRLEHRSGRLSALAVSPDGSTVALGSRNGTVKLWRPAAGGSLTTLKRSRAPVAALTFSLDRRFLVAAAVDGSIQIWDVPTWKKSISIKSATAIRSLAFSPDGDAIAVAGDHSAIELWDVITGSKQATLESGAHRVTCIAFSPDAKTLASGHDDGRVGLWQAWTGREINSLRHQGGVSALAFAHDGRLLAAGGERGMRLWHIVPMPEA